MNNAASRTLQYAGPAVTLSLSKGLSLPKGRPVYERCI